MKKFALSIAACAVLGAAAMNAQAAGWGDALREGASQLGAGSGAEAGAAGGSGLGGMLGSGGSALSGLAGLTGLTGSGTASNAAGVITYCMKNNYLNADKAAEVKEQLLGKLGLGHKEEPKDEGYASGLAGMIKGANGQSFSLDSIKGKAKEKACDLVLDNAKSLL